MTAQTNEIPSIRQQAYWNKRFAEAEEHDHREQQRFQTEDVQPLFDAMTEEHKAALSLWLHDKEFATLLALVRVAGAYREAQANNIDKPENSPTYPCHDR